MDGTIKGDNRWARVWAYVRGPGLTAASHAIDRSEAFLAKVQAQIEAAWRPHHHEAPEAEQPRKIHASLRYTDLNLDNPEDALQALRRASRVPPHQRHLNPEDE
jgi:hypothetical protein